MSKKPFWLVVILIGTAIAASAAVYPQLPETIATHWNAAGEADGYSSRFFGVALLPIMMLAMAVLFAWLPKIDPLKKNYPAFRNVYDAFVVALMSFLLLVQSVILAEALGYHVSVGTVLLVGVGGLFVFIGKLMPKIKRNWFMGIRTPWTLSSDTVWEKSHRMGGKIFVGIGVLSVLAAWLPGEWSIWILLVGAIGGSLGTAIYSYLVYREEQQRGEQ